MDYKSFTLGPFHECLHFNRAVLPNCIATNALQCAQILSLSFLWVTGRGGAKTGGLKPSSQLFLVFYK